MNKTVRELALEHRVAELERELHLARVASGQYIGHAAVTPPIETEIPIPHPVELRMAARWNCDIDAEGNWLVRARGWSKDRQQFGYSYYVAVNTLQRCDLLNLLGHLHERTIKELAREFGKQYKPA